MVPRTDVEAAREAALVHRLTHAASADEHSGVMIALVPRAEDARRLAVVGGEAVEELHVTLYYFGKTTLRPIGARLVEAVRETVGRYAPIVGAAFGAGIFNPTGDEPCMVLNVGGEALDALRSELGWRLDSTPSDSHRPWAAHLTLRYFGEAPVEILPGADLAPRMGPVMFDRVRIAFAGESIDIPFTDSLGVQAARSAAAIYEVTRAGASITACRGAERRAPSFAACKSAPIAPRVDGDAVMLPVVPFVEGVRRAANAANPELYMASEFEKALESALQMPVVFQHPTVDGAYVSIHDSRQFDPHTGVRIGLVTAGRFDAGRMLVDVVLWPSKLRELTPGGAALADALLRGEQTEVSIGHFANVLPIGGIFQGHPFFGVHTDVVFDHLALLPLGQPGACDLGAGCGTQRG